MPTWPLLRRSGGLGVGYGDQVLVTSKEVPLQRLQVKGVYSHRYTILPRYD